MGGKLKPDNVKICDIEECIDSIVQSFAAVQTKIDQCKALEENGVSIQLESNTSFEIGKRAMTAATKGINRALRENEETNLQHELDLAMEMLVDLQSAADNAVAAAKRGKVSVFCWNSAQVACDRFEGFAKKVEAHVDSKMRELARD